MRTTQYSFKTRVKQVEKIFYFFIYLYKLLRFGYR
jgi:hypothetical protein